MPFFHTTRSYVLTTCYHCATQIPRDGGYRRNVVVARRSTLYAGSRKGISVGKTEALRTLCGQCAKEYDEAYKGSSTRALFSIAAAIIGFLFSFRINVHNAVESAMFAFFFFGGPGFISYFLLTALHHSRLRGACQADQYEDSNYGTALEIAVDKNDLDLLQQPTIRIMEQAANLGISFTGLHDIPSTAEGFFRLVEILNARHPAAGFPSIDDWHSAVKNEIFRKFVVEANELTERLLNQVSDTSIPETVHGEKRALWSRLFEIFPANENEDSDAYFRRLFDTKELITTNLCSVDRT